MVPVKPGVYLLDVGIESENLTFITVAKAPFWVACPEGYEGCVGDPGLDAWTPVLPSNQTANVRGTRDGGGRHKAKTKQDHRGQKSATYGK